MALMHGASSSSVWSWSSSVTASDDVLREVIWPPLGERDTGERRHPAPRAVSLTGEPELQPGFVLDPAGHVQLGGVEVVAVGGGRKGLVSSRGHGPSALTDSAIPQNWLMRRHTPWSVIDESRGYPWGVSD
jgi:hypothetical protein